MKTKTYYLYPFLFLPLVLFNVVNHLEEPRLSPHTLLFLIWLLLLDMLDILQHGVFPVVPRNAGIRLQTEGNSLGNEDWSAGLLLG